MLATDSDEKKEVDALKAKRDLIFARLLKNPHDTHLALEIKTIDDQVAECVKQMKQNRKVRK